MVADISCILRNTEKKRTNISTIHLAVLSLLNNLDDNFVCNSEYDIWPQCVPYVLSVLYTWNLNVIVNFPIRHQNTVTTLSFVSAYPLNMQRKICTHV
jgi:hypothetical protein